LADFGLMVVGRGCGGFVAIGLGCSFGWLDILGRALLIGFYRRAGVDAAGGFRAFQTALGGVQRSFETAAGGLRCALQQLR